MRNGTAIGAVRGMRNRSVAARAIARANVSFNTQQVHSMKGAYDCALLPTAGPDHRAGLLAAFYLQFYLTFSLPALAAGLLVPLIGLSTVAYVYGAVIILLAVVSMIAPLWTDLHVQIVTR
ncbi:hypothetical protein ACVWWO_007374 [Bradyrhizobium sp. F1.13.1]